MRSIEVGSGPSRSPAHYQPPHQPQPQLQVHPNPAIELASSDSRPESSEYQNTWSRNDPPDVRRPDRPLYYSDLAGPRNPHDAPITYTLNSRRRLSNEAVFVGIEDETQRENEIENQTEEEWTSRLAIASEDFTRALERQRQPESDRGHSALVRMVRRMLHSRSRTQDQNRSQDQDHGRRISTIPLAATWYQFPTGHDSTASPAPATSAESPPGRGVWDELHQLEQRVSDGLAEALYQQPPPSWLGSGAEVQCPDCGHRFRYQHLAEESHLGDF